MIESVLRVDRWYFIVMSIVVKLSYGLFPINLNFLIQNFDCRMTLGCIASKLSFVFSKIHLVILGFLKRKTYLKNGQKPRVCITMKKSLTSASKSWLLHCSL